MFNIRGDAGDDNIGSASFGAAILKSGRLLRKQL
jgi:hypothetical protein